MKSLQRWLRQPLLLLATDFILNAFKRMKFCVLFEARVKG